MKNFVKLTKLFFILIFLTSCKSPINNEELIKNSQDAKSEQINTKKSKMELKFSCGEDGVSEFLNDGWIIVEEYKEEKVCTWKSYPANEDCDMEKDKGCKITVPDKIGEEKTYLLEKQLKIMPKNQEYLIEIILEKLKKIKSKKLNLTKKEFTKFIESLINN